jgi:ribonuclease HI/transcription elongation factor Elf1
MGLGWLIISNNSQVAQFYASSFNWPSSTRMELMAVVSLLCTLPFNSSINIYTDSNNIIEKYKHLNKIISFRKKRKIVNYNLWEILFWIQKELALKINFFKVKAHSGDLFNDKADNLAKLGSNEKLPLRIKDIFITQKATLAWMEHSVDIDPQKFINNVNNNRIEIGLNNLNRMNNLLNVDKDMSIDFINYIDEKHNQGFFSLKDDNTKSFHIKKLFNELPTMENLKKRNPKIYLKSFNCPRCDKDKETLSHLWNCKKANNDIILLCLKMKNKLFKLIRKGDRFKNLDDLFDELYPFFKTSKHLKRHTKQNSDYYKNFDDKKFRMEYTYVWNQVDSIDPLLQGWIPLRLINLLCRYMKRISKNFIKSILIKWLGKVNKFFFDQV